MPEQDDFYPIFVKLKQLLQSYEKKLLVKANNAENYSLDAPYSEKFQREMFFGAAQVKKNYVSFHLMPVYIFPDLLQKISPALKKRMQGKSCFNFTAGDDDLFRELAQLTEKGFERYRKEKLI